MNELIELIWQGGRYQHVSEHGQKLSGKKAQLITRIIETVPLEALQVPKVYALTAAGRTSWIRDLFMLRISR